MSSDAFPGAYIIPGENFRPPFDQESEAVNVTDNPLDMGETRVYRVDRADSPREVDLSEQEQAPKPAPSHIWRPGADPYAIGGGIDSYLSHQA